MSLRRLIFGPSDLERCMEVERVALDTAKLVAATRDAEVDRLRRENEELRQRMRE